MKDRVSGALAVLLLGSSLFMGLLSSCGTGEPIQPAATSSSNQSESYPSQPVQPAYRHRGGDSYEAVVESVGDPKQAGRLMAFKQQLRDAESETIEDVLAGGLNSPDPAIRLMALDRLEPMLRWNAQARSDVEQILQHETDPGMQMRMSDLLAKPADPILELSAADAAQN